MNQSTLSIESLVLPTRLDEINQRRELVTVPIRRLGKHEWGAVHRDETWRVGPVATHTDRSDLSTYVIFPEVVAGVDRSVYDEVVLYAAITTAGAIFLWPRRVGDRTDGWSLSNSEAIQLAQKGWVRMAANMSSGAYDVHTPVGQLAEPAWPDGLTFERLMEVALKNRVIDSPDHPVLRRLRGDF